MSKDHSLKLFDDQNEKGLTIQIEGDPSDTENSSHRSDGTPAKKNKWNSLLRYVSLVVLIVQNTALVLLMSYASQRKQQKFLKTVAVFYNEVLKLIGATILFVISTGSLKESFRLFKQHFIIEWFDTLKVGVPAIIYTIQNFLVYIAIDHLDAATYMVTYQLKILTTALFTVTMLKRRLSVAQWISLCVLIGGVALVQINAGTSGKEVPALNATLNGTMPHAKMANGISSDAMISRILKANEKIVNALKTGAPVPNTISSASIANATNAIVNSSSVSSEQETVRRPLIGFACVLAACFMSGFAGIYFEKILKGSDVSIWLRNIQLAVLALPISLIVIYVQDCEQIKKDGFMQGFDAVVWSIVSVQAIGGLVVAIALKYADNILKAFASSISIVLSAIASIILFSMIPKALFVAGVALVIFSAAIYSMFPYKAPKKAIL